MKYTTLGVIGHVDHGKTSLVKALTGKDTDRLREEKERGISIVLGYADLELPAGRVGIVDAPGHERFIRTMISGATAIEAVLLVVDVNEGVKPQTIEHLDIAQLLGVRRGIIAITKCDMAGADMRELAAAELTELVKGTFLESAPIVAVSSLTGEGLDTLRERLNEVLDASTPLADEGFAYLPVDRVFTMTGFGTVVTGTLRRGPVRSGDELEIYPSGGRVQVRDLQSHGEFTERAAPGFRAAINLRGVEKSAISRGDVLATPASLRTTNILDVELRLLSRVTAPLKHRQYVRVLFGTRETYAHVHLLDRDVLDPGCACCLQLRLDEECAVLAREPFIVRSYSPMQTIGGGLVLDAADHGYRRREGQDLERLRALADGNPAPMVHHKLVQAHLQTTPVRDLARDLRLSIEVVRASIREIGVIVIAKEFAVGADAIGTVRGELIEALRKYHEDKPTSPGVPREEIAALLASTIEDRLLNYTIDSACKDHLIAAEGGVLRLLGFDPVGVMSAADRDAVEQLEAAFRIAKFGPPDLDEEVGEDARRQKLYKYLLDSKRLLAARITTRNQNQNKYIAFHADSIAEARVHLERAFAESGRFTTLEAKDVLGVTRKYLIPLLEILDGQGFTRRQDDTRYIRRS